jgi:hypothetical protein
MKMNSRLRAAGLLILFLIGSAYGLYPRGDGGGSVSDACEAVWNAKLGTTIGNSLFVYPTDDLEVAYAKIVADANMDTLSSTNRRQFVRTPGTYTMTKTVIMDTSYVDVVDLIPNSVTIVKSGNCMGFVLLPGVDALNGGAADDRAYAGRYSRPTVASKDSTSYAINAPISRSMPVMGFPTVATESVTDCNGSLPMTIQYVSGSGVYLYGSYGAAIFKAYLGFTWLSAGANAPAAVGQIWSASATVPGN